MFKFAGIKAGSPSVITKMSLDLSSLHFFAIDLIAISQVSAVLLCWIMFGPIIVTGTHFVQHSLICTET